MVTIKSRRFKKYDCSKGCPVEFTLEKMGGKWKGVLLYELLNGTRRFSELKKMNEGLTTRILTKQLRELESDGLITRKVYPVIPPKVEYSLSDEGKTLRPIILSLEQWGKIRLSQN
jgi:DNA-binding HxlR family transcriptional regulator